jgi:hypothetical protein
VEALGMHFTNLSLKALLSHSAFIDRGAAVAAEKARSPNEKSRSLNAT